MREGSDEAMKAVYVPPRPFPAPVWEPSATGYWMGPLLLALTIGWLVAACWRVFHRRRGGSLARAENGGLSERSDATIAVELAIGRVRGWVAERLGTGVETLTCEELAESDVIRKKFGAEGCELLLRFLGEAEAARWSGRTGEQEGWSEAAERVI